MTEIVLPTQARVDHWISAGSEVSPHYDPLLAKIIVTGSDRDQAVSALQSALDETRISGLETNLDWLGTVVRDQAFVSGKFSTTTLADIAYAPSTVQAVVGGLATTIQDYPGRLGAWSVGVPPSGPMDSLSFRLGNRLLGNPEGAAGIEFTIVGPTLTFNAAARLCLSGAEFEATLDRSPIPWHTPFEAAPGQTLRIGRVRGAGLRGYLLVGGGWDTPSYLGSQSTFTLGGFGGHGGRPIVAGDTLRFRGEAGPARRPEKTCSVFQRPALTHKWTLRVLSGPHGAPDFFTGSDIAMICETGWRVHHNSDRTGIRLIGQKPQWARADGGEAGLHPSNIHDSAYSVGSVDFTGDMPIILGPDGPSLGGFVCPFVIIDADLWQLGQIAPGDTVRFVVVDDEIAASAARAQNEAVDTLRGLIATQPSAGSPCPSPILLRVDAAAGRPQVVYRRQGDNAVLVEYGPTAFDLELRMRVHALMMEIEALALPEIVDLTPGIRSLQIHYDGQKLPRSKLLAVLESAEERIGTSNSWKYPPASFICR